MRKTILLFTILLISILFFACSGEGLFYTIENEELIEDNNMANIKFADVIVTTDYYVARGVKLWYRSKSGSSWSTIKSAGDYVTSMAYYQGIIYYAVRDGSSAFIYELDIDDVDGPGAGNLIYSTSCSSSNDYVWLQLFADPNTANNRMFINRVEYQDDDDGDPQTVLSELYFTDAADLVASGGNNDGTVTDDGWATDLASALSNVDLDSWPVQPKGIAFGSGTTDAWLIYNAIDDDLESGGVLYSTTDNFATAPTQETSQASGYYNSIYYADTAGTDWLMISSRTDWSASEFDLLYSSDDGSTWAKNDDCGYLFSSFTYNSAVGYILGCTSGDYYTSPEGYVLLSTTSLGISEDDDDIADSSNYESSDLIDSSVYAMAVDTAPASGSAYALVAGTSTGVWTLDSSSADWEQE